MKWIMIETARKMISHKHTQSHSHTRDEPKLNHKLYRHFIPLQCDRLLFCVSFLLCLARFFLCTAVHRVSTWSHETLKKQLHTMCCFDIVQISNSSFYVRLKTYNLLFSFLFFAKLLKFEVYQRNWFQMRIDDTIVNSRAREKNIQQQWRRRRKK